MAAGEIDDAQPPHTQPDTGLDVNPFVVWAAVADDLAHAMDQVEIRAGGAIGVDESGYSTHTARRS
jgi:hypothetical protein